VYQDDLSRALNVTGNQLNVDIHRIRKQLGGLGLADPAAIIERRPRSGQLRIGVSDIIITRA
jgi:hypothetical protein